MSKQNQQGLRFTKLLIGPVVVIVFLALSCNFLNQAATPVPTQTPHPVCATQTEILQLECEALVALYDATGGEGWYENEGWLVSERICSSWWGITCMDGHVTGIELFENNLNGELPHEIGNLSKLQDIDLRFNNLSELPPEIGNLSNLQWLYLPSNKLSELPPEIGNLSSLEVLNLSWNKLSDLPSEIGNLSNLQQLYLGTNNLSDLPPEICSLDVSNIGNSSLCP